MSDTTERWLDIEAAARHLRVQPHALTRLVRLGRLPAASYALGPRSPRWDRELLDKQMAGVVNGAAGGTTSPETINEASHANANQIRSRARSARRSP